MCVCEGVTGCVCVCEGVTVCVCVCVKVLLANSKRQGSVRDQHEDEKMMRLFIMIPTSFSENDVRDEFSVSVVMMMMKMMMMIMCDSEIVFKSKADHPQTHVFSWLMGQAGLRGLRAWLGWAGSEIILEICI